MVKTTYQIVISKEPTFQSNPLAFGSGFFMNFKDKLFFITADHNIHIEDHQINERTGVDNYVGIFNNISDRNNFSTIITPVGGFYYMESFDISKNNLNIQLVDVAISMVDREKFEAPFFTDENIPDQDENLIVSQNQQKFEFLEEHIVEPSGKDTYFIYGKIKPNFKGLFLHRDITFKNNLKYINSYGDYLLLNTDKEISDYENWAGLSGSPVINQDGKCVGVLCSINEGTKSVFVKPFSKILPFLDTIILQEQHQLTKSNENI
ncbi:hypothetical protein [Chryseobacterium scophthalmum]|uniref:Trypsin-like peptidase domain-containing protein n=1 Tax=Chryseobacterium scophthalmum TaxID=59733 RepID=A0A1N6FPS6_9FLAO|nr:hypothetical protein [Chryseobacterium scophthalmum]SIN97297.1 hypothetical protein SAMN05421769_1496 [Chryseobacterium scophthalmum]